MEWYYTYSTNTDLSDYNDTLILEKCIGCDGNGVQTDKNGIKQICPCCNGTGNWNRKVGIIKYINYD